MRADLCLFRARLFKSRSKASTACREGRILCNGSALRSSSEIKAGDLVKIREKGLYREIRILELPGKNMSKEAAREIWRDETPGEVTDQRKLIELAARVRGARREGARPTKKERRTLDKVRGRK